MCHSWSITLGCCWCRSFCNFTTYAFLRTRSPQYSLYNICFLENHKCQLWFASSLNKAHKTVPNVTPIQKNIKQSAHAAYTVALGVKRQLAEGRAWTGLPACWKVYKANLASQVPYLRLDHCSPGIWVKYIAWSDYGPNTWRQTSKSCWDNSTSTDCRWACTTRCTQFCPNATLLES
jgi:hypothetical protein